MIQKWDYIIDSKSTLHDMDIKELIKYRDLLVQLVRRDFVAVYKQTILGPAWFFIQPILTVLMFTVVFGNIANISTDGLPHLVFYLSGLILWNYFAGCFTATSETFVQNTGIFGKVYFPRLIIPLSIVISKLITFGIQFLLFLFVYFFYIFKNSPLQPNAILYTLPLLVFITAGLALGSGLIITSLTTKYRDMRFLLQFVIQLAMYATPIIYPLSATEGKLRLLILANPMSSMIEAFRFAFTGTGEFSWVHIGYSFSFMIMLLTFGIMIFNKTQKNFMDTV
jgi:lipopolysaccharide transport system permease protein